MSRERINQLRRGADQRVLRAVKDLRAASPAEAPAARAALRETCDQVITELTDAADLLIPTGKRMLRQQAARIQWLRDQHCEPAGDVGE